MLTRFSERIFNPSRYTGRKLFFSQPPTSLSSQFKLLVDYDILLIFILFYHKSNFISMRESCRNIVILCICLYICTVFTTHGLYLLIFETIEIQLSRYFISSLTSCKLRPTHVYMYNCISPPKNYEQLFVCVSIQWSDSVWCTENFST